MFTHDGYYKQTESLAMGVHLLRTWQMDDGCLRQETEGDGKMSTHYMDDILRDIKLSEIEKILVEINFLHPNPLFTI